ncbi:MAG: ethylbenzene dehydrogenase-related protein [Rhodothermales bacterium]|nr:ethylbenzene dehydrogenase-related protein [Rhodothermales bacterium]
MTRQPILSFLLAGALATPALAQNTTLVVQPGAPVLDGVVSAGEWASSPLVTARGVTLNAMADGDYLYVAASWADATEDASHSRYNFNGTGWSKAGDEDRIAFVFDMGQTGADGANCQAFCHFPIMSTNGGMVDVWQWRASRSNPMGIADDTHWNATGQIHDDGVTAVLLNAQDEITGLPGFMASVDPGAIANFLVENADVLAAFDPYGVQAGKKIEEAVAFNAGATFAANDKIPGHVLRIPSGSVADVKAAGAFGNGVWTVEFKRPYAGGAQDFTVVPGASVQFAHELFDNQGSNHALDATAVDPTLYTMDFSAIVGVSVEPVSDALPRRTALGQNYPNPFTGATSIEVEIAEPAFTRLDVLDLHGRVVRTLLQESLAPGPYRIPFDSRDLASGSYFYRLTNGAYSETRAMVLVR